MRRDCCTPREVDRTVTVNVDVTKIVKYTCITGVFIVGIIFGTRCYNKMLKYNKEIDL